MKDRLIFDTTDANTIAESDSIGAFIRSSDGTLITHTTVGGKEALDVRIAEGINVEVDLDAADDSVAAHTFDGAGNSIGSTGGALHISDAGGSLTVDAVDLDIRDLTFATDSVDVSNSTNVAVVDGGGSLTVDAVDLDIRDLTAASDSVQSNLFDGAGTALTSTLVGADQALDVNVANDIAVNDAALANTAIANDALAIAAASVAESLVGTALVDRKYLYAYNADNRTMYIGASGVTVADGFPVSPGSYLELRAGASVDVQVISEKIGHDIRTLELS